MSEEQLGSDEIPLSRLNNALVEFTGCVGNALPDICSYGLTVGDSYVPFDPDDEDGCEDEEVACSQVWVRVVTARPAATTESWAGECGGVTQLVLEVGVLRCFVIPEEGEAPTASEVLAASLVTMDDMQTIYCAAMSCGGDVGVWDSIESGEWQPTGPLGGQYGGMWTFTVEIT